MSSKNSHSLSSMRINNRRLVLEILRNSKAVTISQISQQIQLSKTTLRKIIDYFIQNNIVICTGKNEIYDEVGKKPDLYQFNENYGYIISISIYGFSILLALTDAKANIFHKETVFIDEKKSLDQIIEMVSSFIRKWQEPDAPRIKKNAKLLGIVIAASGVIDTEQGCCFTASRFHSWPTKVPIKELIKEKVELKVPFYIDNYNRFFAFAEKTMGCAINKKNIVDVVAWGDGLGAGIIAENKIKRGPKHLTGEIGHMCLNRYDTETCHCGGKGCFEQLVSCERLIRKAEENRSIHPDSEIYNNNSTNVTLQKIFDSANNGDKWACFLIDEIIDWFAIAFQNITLVFNSEIIILSGDYRNAGPYFIQQLSEKMERVSLLRMEKNIELQYSSFDEEGALIGGASYVLHDYFTNRME